MIPKNTVSEIIAEGVSGWIWPPKGRNDRNLLTPPIRDLTSSPHV